MEPAKAQAPSPPVDTDLQPWEREWNNVVPILEDIERERAARKVKRPLHVHRVNQLDAVQLDNEIANILRAQLYRIFEFFKNDVVERFKPELTALLHFLMYRMSVVAVDATYGSKLQNLTYRNEREHRDDTQPTTTISPLTTTQKTLYGLFFIGGSWGWERLTRVAMSQGWGDRAPSDPWGRLWRVLTVVESIYRLLSLANFLGFLLRGRYPSLLERLLSMRLVYARPSMARFVSFEFMNRQLVWHGFTEFLLFLQPLVNLDRVKMAIKRMFASREVNAAIPEGVCPLCQASPPNTPYVCDASTSGESVCKDIFCYYCIRVALLQDRRISCPRCGNTVEAIRRYDPARDGGAA